MSAVTEQPNITIDPKLRRRLERRRDRLLRLAETSGIMNEQEHLDEGTKARLYWHYGYAMGLRDVLAKA